MNYKFEFFICSWVYSSESAMGTICINYLLEPGEAGAPAAYNKTPQNVSTNVVSSNWIQPVGK